jgi:hypothetical protein
LVADGAFAQHASKGSKINKAIAEGTREHLAVATLGGDLAHGRSLRVAVARWLIAAAMVVLPHAAHGIIGNRRSNRSAQQRGRARDRRARISSCFSMISSPRSSGSRCSNGDRAPRRRRTAP